LSENTLTEKLSCRIRQHQRLFRDFSEFSVCVQRNVFLACGVISTCAFPSLRRLALRPTPVFGWLPNGFTGLPVLPVSNGEAAEKGLGGASIDTRLLLSACSSLYSGHSLCCTYGFYCLVLHFIFFSTYSFFLSPAFPHGFYCVKEHFIRLCDFALFVCVCVCVCVRARARLRVCIIVHTCSSV
jgi:hypothetical protein